MKKALLLLSLVSLILSADEYGFDIESIEQTPYEYSGYLRLEDKLQRQNRDGKSQNYIHLEGLFDFTYNYENLKLKSSFMGIHDYIKEKSSQSDASVNELYLEAKLSTNHSLLAGKESLQWGKGYFSNPVAFFDRVKDPAQPTLAREGYIIGKYSYNKSFDTDLKNLSFDMVYLPSSKDINKEYNQDASSKKDLNNFAARIYLLLYDTDIDFIYNYSDGLDERIGIDFSKNIETNFEVHGEYAYVMDDSYSYLLGIRYLTDSELTIISEYLYSSTGLNKEEIESSNSIEPFLAKDYLITLATQKEPFNILYFSVYAKNMTNMQDHSMQNKVGFTYSFKNNVETDLSYNKNSGSAKSEFGKKQISDFLWMRITWSF